MRLYNTFNEKMIAEKIFTEFTNDIINDNKFLYEYERLPLYQVFGIWLLRNNLLNCTNVLEKVGEYHDEQPD